MFKVIGAFLQPYISWIVGGVIALAVGTVCWMWVDLNLTKAALRDAQGDLKVAEQTIKAQERAIEAVNHVEEYRNETNRLLRALNTRIMEAEGANQEVPPAVANAWADGIDCLRAHSCGDPGHP